MKTIGRLSAGLSILLLAACATSPARFYDNPGAVKDTPLCRAYLDTTDTSFRNDVASELGRRGLTRAECESKVQTENTVLAVSAVAAGVATIAVACSNGSCPSGGGGSSVSDVDCYGGTGNGPRYVRGPIYVGSDDPFDLDRDGDGVGCEASDLRRGG